LTDHDRFTEEGAQRFVRAVCSAFGKRVLNREQTRSRDALRLDGVWSSGARGCAVEDALTKSSPNHAHQIAFGERVAPPRTDALEGPHGEGELRQRKRERVCASERERGGDRGR